MSELAGAIAGRVAVALLVSAGLVLAIGSWARPDAQGEPLVWALGCTLGMVVLGALLAWQRAKRVASELSLVTEAVEGMAKTHEAADATQALSLHSVEARKLRDALQHLTERARRLRAREEREQHAIEDEQRVRARFVASLSHDLRAPLNSILGFTELLTVGTEGPLNDKQRYSLELIQRSAQDLLKLLDDILDWTKLEAGRMELSPEWVPARELLREAQARGEQMLAGRPLGIQMELGEELPRVNVDRQRVIQAILGILGHAMRAMDQGTITIRARTMRGPPGPPTYVRVDVIDGSEGIRDADRAQIFEAFREIVEPSGKRIGGMGLGLALARGLIRAHGGDAWFESERGRGTTFTVAIPLDSGDDITNPGLLTVA